MMIALMTAGRFLADRFLERKKILQK